MASTRSPPRGVLSVEEFGPGDTVYTTTYIRHQGSASVSFFMLADQDGEALIERIDDSGTAHPLRHLPVAIPGGVEQRHLVYYPARALRLRYRNMNATAGTLRVEVAESDY